MNLRVAAAVTVEIFQVGKTGNRWKARTLDGELRPARMLTFDDKSDLVGVSAGHAQTMAAGQFEEQLSVWRSWTR